MIWYSITNALVSGLNVLFAWLPHVTELPWGADAVLTTAFGYWYSFLNVFWPLQIVWTMVLVYYGVRLAMLVTRMIPFVGRGIL